MASALRLVWKQYRFELAAVAVALVVLSVATVIISMGISAVQPSADCYASYVANSGDSLAPGCPDLQPWFDARLPAGQLMGIYTYLPVIVGALLGSVLVSREIEQCTTQLSWALQGSRRRWLTERVVPVALLLAVLLAVLALAVDLLQSSLAPGVGAWSTLAAYGERDIAMVARGLAAFGLAVLVGSIAGRQLPAVIVSGALALLILVAVNGAFPLGVAARWVSKGEYAAMTLYGRDAAVLLGQGRMASDGSVVSDEAARALAPAGLSSDATDVWVKANFKLVSEVLEGSQLVDIELREAVLLGGFTLLALGAAFVVVDRRRPD